MRSGFRVVIAQGTAIVKTVPQRDSTWKEYKLKIARRFATKLARQYPDLRASFTLFGREKAPLDGSGQGWFVCAQRPGQDYQLFPDYICQDEGRIGKFRNYGGLCDKTAKWKDRRTVAVFRGTNNRDDIRRTLAKLSCAHPNMLNARLVMTPRRETRKRIAPKLWGSRLKMAQFAQYRYQVNTDSWGGLIWKLMSGSVVIELVDREVPWMTWHHTMLKPYEHYVPATIDTVLDQIEWCRENDDECRKIAAAGRKLARKHLSFDGALRFAERVLR